MRASGLDEAVSLANDTEYGLASSICTTGFSSAMRAVKELSLGKTWVNRENFEAMHGFLAGVRKHCIGGADCKHGVYEYCTFRRKRSLEDGFNRRRLAPTPT